MSKRRIISRVYVTYFLDGLPIVLGVLPHEWTVENLFINGYDYSRVEDVRWSTLEDLHSKGIDYKTDAKSLFETYENLNEPIDERVS